MTIENPLKQQNSVTYIRKAQKEDCPEMFELVKELALFEKAPEEVSQSIEDFTESGFGINPVWEAIVAEDEHKQLQGMALFYIRFSTWKGKMIYLEDLIVRNHQRGKGIGKALMKELTLLCKDRNYYGITWQVLNWNEKAIHFYKKNNAIVSKQWYNCTLVMKEPN